MTAAGQALDRESLPAKYRRSTTVLSNQPITWLCGGRQAGVALCHRGGGKG